MAIEAPTAILEAAVPQEVGFLFSGYPETGPPKVQKRPYGTTMLVTIEAPSVGPGGPSMMETTEAAAPLRLPRRARLDPFTADSQT